MMSEKQGGRGGYLLLETLSGVTVATLFAGLLTLGYGGLLRHVARMQLDMVTNGFVLDLQQIRSDSIFRSRPAREAAGIYLYKDQSNGYQILRGTNEVRRRDFLADYGTAVYFVSVPFREIQFTTQGSPRKSGIFTLAMKGFPGLKKQVEIQPVTGRIKVTDW